MDTDEELKQVARDLGVVLRFVSSKDQLPHTHLYGSYIVNMEDDTDYQGMKLPGSHWVCFYIEQGKAVYMDPFGLPPPSQVQMFLYKLRPYTVNNRQIQSVNTGHCGMYCMCFLDYMTHSKIRGLKERFHRWLGMWDADEGKNLEILNNYFKRISPKLKIY